MGRTGPSRILGYWKNLCDLLGSLNHNPRTHAVVTSPAGCKVQKHLLGPKTSLDPGEGSSEHWLAFWAALQLSGTLSKELTWLMVETRPLGILSFNKPQLDLYKLTQEII